MRLCCNFWAAALILATASSGLRPPRSYYRRSYFSALAPGAGHGHGSGSSSSSLPGPVRLGSSGYLRSDLQTNESKHRHVSKKYPKKSHYRPYGSQEEDDYSGERYNSAEYSAESSVQDSREYSIGTQIRVQHPITVPKKASSSGSGYPKQPKYVTAIPYKATGYGSDVHIGSASGEDVGPPPKRSKWNPVQYDAEVDPFHLVPPPKATAASSSNSYSVYEADHDDYEVAPVPRPKSHDRYKNVASKKQIEAYLEDQQKLLDEAIKVQLLNNPKLQKFLKAQAQEHEHESRPDLEIEDFEAFPPNFSGPGPLRGKYLDHPPHPPKGSRSRRLPPSVELHRPPKSKPLLKPKRKYRSTALVINV
ncbi:uncharacterized protein [Drosophila kikkawai]|uniref:Uncharacterized protein n=1 Tax=Drosophila kikkawai TaxID=30033 RepID=A0A6P4HYU0_DROKI|nr:uncharacterized protein LOC108073706 [Drosophila kikkawai]